MSRIMLDRIVRTGLAAALVGGLSLPAAIDAQERQTERNAFQWSGRIPAGAWLRVRNINGPITVVAGTGAAAEVTADKSWRRGDPSQVRVEMVPDGNNVTICAIWHENVRCDEDGYHGRGRSENNGDVSVAITVRLPRGVNTAINTVNGSVSVEGATGQVEAQTVNGGVTVSSSAGPVSAQTTNGQITASMGGQLTNDVSFRTVNGSIALTVPASINADLEMRTVNGSLSSDFPITISGQFRPRSINAKLGNGGPTLHVQTVNGSISIKRGN